MSFAIRRIEAEPEVCKHCGGETRCAIEELIIDAAGIAIERKFNHLARCRACGMLARELIAKPDELADTKLARKWFIGTIVLAMALLATWVSCWYWSKQQDRGFVVSPLVGDRWTIDLDGWPEKVDAQYRYTRVKVTEVSSDAVGLAACDMAYKQAKDAREECDTFGLEIDDVPRATLGGVYDRAVDSVDTERDDKRPIEAGFGITVGLIALWNVIASRLKKRYALADF